MKKDYMKYQQNSKREEKSKFITNQLTNMAHIPIRSYLYLLLGTTLFSCVPQELKPPFELKCENIPVPVGVDTQIVSTELKYGYQQTVLNYQADSPVIGTNPS